MIEEEIHKAFRIPPKSSAISNDRGHDEIHRKILKEDKAVQSPEHRLERFVTGVNSGAQFDPFSRFSYLALNFFHTLDNDCPIHNFVLQSTL